MHWACKRGDENLAKLLAGVSRSLVNERSVSILLTRYCKKYYTYILYKEKFKVLPNILVSWLTLIA